MADEKPKSRRKGRRARLGPASYGGTISFKPSDEDWERISQALGYRFIPEDVNELVQLVDNYFDMLRFETTAAFVSDAQAYLQSLTVKGYHFLLALQAPASQEAAFVVQRRIVNAMPRRRYKGAVVWQEFVMANQEVIAACEQVKTKLKKATRMRARGTFVEGSAWRGLVRYLTHFCKKRSLPTTVSKARADKPSTFVAFVFELQQAFPNEFSRHLHSHAALATAIVEARRPVRRRRKNARRAGAKVEPDPAPNSRTRAPAALKEN